MIEGVHHFALIAKSELSVEFYNKLGFRELKRIERKNDTIVLMYGYGIQIEMFIDPRHPARSSPEPLGLRHIALSVDSIDDVVRELGLEIGPIMRDWFDRKFCFTTDPDGLTIELRERDLEVENSNKATSRR